jgi:putative hydrolase of the HAD superfamily
MTMKSWYMKLKIDKNTILVIDLDDTLCYEADFVMSGLKQASLCTEVPLNEKVFFLLQQGFAFGMPPFDYLFSVMPELNAMKLGMLEAYRNHIPDLKFKPGAQELLNTARINAAAIILITDGRSISQRNKLKGLSLESFFDEVYISEEKGAGKLEPDTYEDIKSQFPQKEFAFIGDNPAKDFFQPLKYGWTCIGVLSDGRNIHPQPEELLRKATGVTFVRSLKEIEVIT